MKITKKLASLLLAMIMLLALSAPTFMVGEEDGPHGEGTMTDVGSITIENAVPGETYNLYQVLYLESYKVEVTNPSASDGSDKIGNYVYKPTSEWKSFLLSDSEATKYIRITNGDDAGYAEWTGDKTNSRAEEFSKIAMNHIAAVNSDGNTSNDISPVLTVKAPELTNEQKAAGETTTKIEFKNLKLGYYLIDTTVGTLCELYTTNNKITIADKNQTPTIKKFVAENGQNANKNNDVSIGDTINFSATIEAKKGAKNYVLHDAMCTGMEFIKVESIKKNNEDPLTPYDKNNANESYDYKVILNNDENKGEFIDDCKKCTFHIKFDQSFLDELTVNDQIDISYTGKLNTYAKIGGIRPATGDSDATEDGNINLCWLTYGEQSKTAVSKTHTFTWSVKVHKFVYKTNKLASETTSPGTLIDGSDTLPLAGAKFKLCTGTKGKDESGKDVYVYTDIKFTKMSSEEGTVVLMRDPDSEESEFSTPASGYIEFQGLDSGTYYLFETAAPEGYNKLSNPITVIIKNDGLIQQNNKSADHIDVLNESGSLMPSTGGIGTTIFYVVGGILLVGAGVLLVVRRRMKTSK